MPPIDPFADTLPSQTTSHNESLAATPDSAPQQAQQVAAASESHTPGQEIGQPNQTAEADGAGTAASTPSAPSSLPGHLTPEEVYEQARYMQAERDRIKAEFNKLQQEKAAYDPLIQRIQSDPVLQETVFAHINGDGARTQAPAPAVAEQPLEPPVFPDDPYDEAAMSKYQKDQTQYLKDAAAQAARQAEARVEGRLQQLQQRDQMAATRVKVEQQARHEFNLSQQEAKDFADKLMSGELLDNEAILVEGYKAVMRRTEVNDPNAARVAEAKAAAEARVQQRMPVTATSVQGGAPPPSAINDPSKSLIVQVEQTARDPWA